MARPEASLMPVHPMKKTNGDSYKKKVFFDLHGFVGPQGVHLARMGDLFVAQGRDVFEANEPQ